MTVPGRFVTFEGGEGAGKSTQIARLAAWARAAAGLPVEVTREPGGTPGAEAIRGLLVTGAADRWRPLTETLLHLAARHDHVVRVVEPALAAGRWVLCDRFSDSTRVYQGLAGGVGVERVDALHALTIGELRPDLTLILDLPAEVGLARRAGDGGGGSAAAAAQANRYERMGQGFHDRVRHGFLEIARREPERCVVIDAGREPDEVARAIRREVERRFAADLAAPR
jgi:dTMP kinase